MSWWLSSPPPAMTLQSSYLQAECLGCDASAWKWPPDLYSEISRKCYLMTLHFQLYWIEIIKIYLNNYVLKHEYCIDFLVLPSHPFPAQRVLCICWSVAADGWHLMWFLKWGVGGAFACHSMCPGVSSFPGRVEAGPLLICFPLYCVPQAGWLESFQLIQLFHVSSRNSSDKLKL